MKQVCLYGLPPGADDAAVGSAVRRVMQQATGDLAWLSAGDTVLLKPALNSADPYPATTHPAAVRTAAALLAERGARVVIGDQSGIEHVLHHPEGVVRGSTTVNFIRSGMAGSRDPEFIGFEDGGWDEGFFRHRSLRTASWKEGFNITSLVREADHIISLPRVSTHSIAGTTLGFKNLVGLLREDSRMEFHANGPMNSSILRSARGSSLVQRDDGRGKFLEKIVEISDAVRDKLRITLFVATVIQATFGPDQYGVRLGPSGYGRAHIIHPPCGLVFGSADPVAAEAMANAVLRDARRSLPFAARALEQIGLARNPLYRLMNTVPIPENPMLRHAMAIGLGDIGAVQIVDGTVPEEYVQQLTALIAGG